MLDRIETPITRMLGIRYPIVCAPMFLVSNPVMLSAVAEAGAIGAMPSLNARTIEEFRAALEAVRSKNTGPFGVNLILLGNPRLAEDLAACVEARVPLVITSLGDPTAVIAACHAHGIKVFCDVVNLKHARKAAAAGADALIAVSAGAGGHAGPIVMNVLVPWLARETGLPVLAAGGIATGRGLLAALALGAGAAYLGTRFIASAESPAPAAFKEMILRASPEEIRNTDRITGHPANFLRESLEAVEAAGPEAKPWRDAWSAGQTVGLIGDVKPIGEIIRELVAGYEEGLQALRASSIG